jgi:hypothetical protein
VRHWLKKLFLTLSTIQIYYITAFQILLSFPSSGEQGVKEKYTVGSHGRATPEPWKPYWRAQQSKFSFISCLPEDGNRTSFQNIAVLIYSDNGQIPEWF